MIVRLRFLLLLLLTALAGQAQDIDVQHYIFWIKLSDASDRIEGTATIKLKRLKPSHSYTLDLVQQRPDGKGMTVSAVLGNGVTGFEQRDNRIIVKVDTVKDRTPELLITIQYAGIPADGLIISRNKFGERTFFSDNWPNRAHHWIPCNDRPDDKATFEFVVTAPKQYDVVSNGVQAKNKGGNTGIVKPDADQKVSYWKMDVPSPTKVMVIGAARFATTTFENSPPDIPVSAWVYPQDQEKGFKDYGLTPGILNFFISYIGPFPFSKLANVQSKTIFGGMENSSAIFYAEESVRGDGKWEDVFAHEIAHQWFGDMATEKSFAHLWLSEGFATYMTDLYIENKYGADSLHKRLAAERAKVRAFVAASDHPVVDTTSNLMSLLNPNSYEKGGWVLHHLRIELGDSVFRQVVREYYSQYKGRNADTRDLQQVAERVSKHELGSFFDQWLYRPGIPAFKVQYEIKESQVLLTIDQEGDVYSVPIEIGIVNAEGEMNIFTMKIDRPRNEFILETGKGVQKVLIDPKVNLLYREVK